VECIGLLGWILVQGMYWNNVMAIVTWNLFSVNQAGSLRSPSDELKKYKIGIGALQEI
jgi:hypothetical protein